MNYSIYSVINGGFAQLKLLFRKNVSKPLNIVVVYGDY